MNFETLTLLFLLIFFSGNVQAQIDVDREVEGLESYLRYIGYSFDPDSLKVHQAAFKTTMLEARKRQGKPGLFGPEFTFTSKEWVEKALRNIWEGSLEIDKVQGRWIQHKMNRVRNPNSRVEFNRVIGNDGWWHEVNTDFGVIEVQAKPQSVSEIKQNINRIQSEVFDFAKSEFGLCPHSSAGGGHIHLDIASVLNHSPILVRNMYVDLENNYAMFLGALGKSFGNSSLAIESEESRKDFIQKLERFDNEILYNNTIPDGIKILYFSYFVDNLTVRTPPIPERASLFKSHLVNMAHVMYLFKGSYYTLEIRGFAPQKNTQSYYLLTQLLEARARMLEKKFGNQRLRYHNQSLDISEVFRQKDSNTRYRMPNPKKSVSQFFHYVVESGLRWDEYRTLMPNSLQSLPELRFSIEEIKIGPS
jgi:hypothetical protein